MAILTPNPVQAEKKAGGDGTITIVHVLSPNELGDQCDMYAKVILPPKCSIGLHEHHGNAESYFILRGKALYNDNGREVELGRGASTFCPDGEKHAIKNASATDDLVFMALIVKTK